MNRPSFAQIVLAAYMGALILAVALAFVAFHRTNEIALNNSRALCNQRAQYQRNVNETNRYLAEHPDGGPFGRPLLNRSLRNAKLQLRSLSDVNCSLENILGR